jgi:hypothetical protein
VRQAHAIARQRCPRLPELRFVGPPDDYVDEATKLQLLGSCRAVVQCSLFEGFGMPVLEALANGPPVLCSDIAPFREITKDGDNALLVDPKSVEPSPRAWCASTRTDLRSIGPVRWHRPTLRRIGVAEQWQRLHTELRAMTMTPVSGWLLGRHRCEPASLSLLAHAGPQLAPGERIVLHRPDFAPPRLPRIDLQIASLRGPRGVAFAERRLLPDVARVSATICDHGFLPLPALPVPSCPFARPARVRGLTRWPRWSLERVAPFV